MGSFLAYTLYSGVFLLLLYLVYRLFISGEKQIVLNRIILLGCYVVSFAVWPLSRLDWSLPESQLPVVTPIIAIGEMPMNAVGIIEEDTSIVPQILLWIYLIGALVVLSKTILSTARLLFYIRKGTFSRKEGYTLVVMPGSDTAPFSFGNHIVMSVADYETVNGSVTVHELAHIRCHHYLDLIFAQTVCVVLWYNPAAWLMREELKLIHEYQADAAVIDSGADPKKYQMLLIRKTVGNRFHTVVNSLNHSKLKNRITMMQKEKSSGHSRLRLLSLALAVDVALAVVNIPAIASGLNSLEYSSLIQDNEVVAVEKIEKSSDHTDAAVKAAEFPGGVANLMEYLAKNIRYPETAMKENRSGRTVVGYTIEKDGKITNIRILKSSWPDCDEEAMRVVKKMPDWIPAKSNDNRTKSEFALPVVFRIPSISDKRSEDAMDEFRGFFGNMLDEIIVVGYGAVKREKTASQKNEPRWYKAVAVNEGTNPDAPIYLEGILADRDIIKSLPPESVESIDVRRPSEEYPEGRVDIKLRKQPETLYLKEKDNLSLVFGPCKESGCDEADHLPAYRVDGKLLTESMTINAGDVESWEKIPPSKEYPNGLQEIKLKKK